LAGEAALQADDAHPVDVADRPDMKLATDPTEEPGRSTGPAAHRPTTPGQSPLSEREREVAELLLLGMPYRDIGAQLFISAKTVEHHVARIRRRSAPNRGPDVVDVARDPGPRGYAAI
jgi:DNA-binding NarL/FixJ family response regulator